MIVEENQTELLEKAKAKELEYHWVEAAEIYNKVADYYKDAKMMVNAAETYKKLGYTSTLAAHTIDTSDKFSELINNAISAYKESARIFKEIGNELSELECKAEEFLVRGFIQSSFLKSEESFKKSYELFKEAREVYAEKSEKENVLKITIREATALGFQQLCSTSGQVNGQLSEEVFNLLPMDLNFYSFNIQAIAEVIYFCYFVSLKRRLTKDYKWDMSFWEKFENLFAMYDEMDGLKLLKDCSDSRSLGMIYFAMGHLYWFYGYGHIDDEREQMEYVNKGLDFLKRSINFLKKTGDKSLIINSILVFNWDAIIIGKYDSVQKTILDDIGETLKYGEIYVGSFSKCEYNGNFLPALGYAGFAHIKYFSIDQRKTFAEMGIKYAKESLNRSFPLPISIYFLQILTFNHSLLSYLSKIKENKIRHAEKMLHYAKEAGKLGEKYEGGNLSSFAYTCLYKAYTTFANITESEEERVQMLSKATEATQKYLEHPVDFRSGNIEAYIRLGTTNEELGSITMDLDTLMRAKEAFLRAIKESDKRGYYQHKATAFEYLARLEDRLGNYKTSAENYGKAEQGHRKSIQIIEYKRVKDRVKEKINYSQSWYQIETAKAYHKNENHLRAMYCYENASEILNNIGTYRYEAPYYSAWALLEEAEHFSKQEQQEEAIKTYESVKLSFEKAIKSLEKASMNIKESRENIRIKRLKQVAKVRINYCTARIHLEKARILGKQGDHTTSAENFALAASLFRNICMVFKIERERRELEAIYYLCKAWEVMELAEKYQEPERLSQAAALFIKASNLFSESKFKLLALGNSAFCQALKVGYKFDESNDIEHKKRLYSEIKILLRRAASKYKKGGFKSGADWALATSTYFDAAYHLLIADEELNLGEKKRVLRIGIGYLKSAAELFSNAGHVEKEKEILETIEMVEKEEKIIISAFNTIKEPSISRSTKGIIAPSCPIETSLSPNINEIREIAARSRKAVSEKSKDLEGKKWLF